MRKGCNLPGENAGWLGEDRYGKREGEGMRYDGCKARAGRGLVGEQTQNAGSEDEE